MQDCCNYLLINGIIFPGIVYKQEEISMEEKYAATYS